MEIKAVTLQEVYEAGTQVGQRASLAGIAVQLLCKIEELGANPEIDKAAALNKLAQLITEECFKSS